MRNGEFHDSSFVESRLDDTLREGAKFNVGAIARAKLPDKSYAAYVMAKA